jgi:predicted transcriptional regulator
MTTQSTPTLANNFEGLISVHNARKAWFQVRRTRKILSTYETRNKIEATEIHKLLDHIQTASEKLMKPPKKQSCH